MSTFIYEIASWQGDPGTAQDWIARDLPPTISTEQEVQIDLYRPVQSRYGDPGPGFILTLGFVDQAGAQRTLSQPDFREVLAEGQGPFQLKGAFMRVHAFAIEGSIPRELSAPFSFVVRYCLPAEDKNEFQAYYMKMHPPILSEFEGIRNIFCQVPEDLCVVAPLPMSEYLIGNEVVFDNVTAFERALNTPVMLKSKADSETFPPYCGINPHFAMERTRLR